mmetsp:Transcript_7122/g.10637  ORF Transcript_7122/g.10637 Transcript_7122/m.10637 type:complete len:775 (+) Transcript_7122:1393-3717(+)
MGFGSKRYSIVFPFPHNSFKRSVRKIEDTSVIVSRNRLLTSTISLAEFGNLSMDMNKGSSARVAHGLVMNVTSQPPPYAFADEWFPVELTVDTQNMESKVDLGNGDKEIRLGAHLYLHDGSPRSDAWNVAELAIDPGTQELLSSDLAMPKSNHLIRFKINPLPRGESHAFFCIKIFAVDFESNIIESIQPVVTSPIHLVSAKIIIESDDWEPIWYKDEGGRDKCMQVLASLCNKDNNLVLNRKVPLKMTLLYDNEYNQEVMKQSNLKVFGPPKQYIDPTSGQATIRFRIEDVSKNHQGQSFKVLVAAENNKLGDIAPAYTPVVAIRSKRNKRGRSSVESPRRHMGVSPYAHHQHMSMIPPNVSIPGSVPGSVPGQFKPTYKKRYPREDRSPMSPGFRGITDVEKLRESMKGVIRWTEEVVNGLHPLQWQVIGYAQYPDGAIDYNHPYYNMPNPNNCITKVLQMYSDTVRDNFRVLLSAVENTVAEEESAAIHGHPSHHDVEETPMAFSNGHQSLQQLKRTAEGIQNQVTGSQMMQQEVGETTPPDLAGSLVSRSFGSGESSSLLYSAPANNGKVRRDEGAPMIDPNAFADDSSRSGRLSLAPRPSVPGQEFEEAFGHHPSNVEGDDRIKTSASAELSITADDFTKTSAPDINSIEHQAAYVLAKQYRSVKTGDRLGFPVFGTSHNLLGFYTGSTLNADADAFTHIDVLDEFGEPELDQAKHILTDARESGNDEVHSIKDYGNFRNLMEHALIYDANKERIANQLPSASTSPNLG